MPKLEKALIIALIISMLISAAFLQKRDFAPADTPAVLCETSMQQQWWAVVFPTLQTLPEGDVQLRLRILELFKNASAR